MSRTIIHKLPVFGKKIVVYNPGQELGCQTRFLLYFFLSSCVSSDSFILVELCLSGDGVFCKWIDNSLNSVHFSTDSSPT